MRSNGAIKFPISRQQMETLADALPFCVGYADAAERVLMANSVTEEWFGLSRATIYGRTLEQNLGAQRYGAIRHHILAALEGESRTFQSTISLPDGRLIDTQSTYAPDREPQGEVRGFFFLGVDLTSRRRMEEELHRSQQVLEFITREQQRISRDLHDTVGQELTALGFTSRKLAQKLAAQGRPEAETAATLDEGVKQAISKLRKAIQGVVPVEVGPEGLMVALEHLATRIRERYGIDCHFECARSVEFDDQNTATELFRIAQEAVNNAVKHGKAGRIVLSLEGDATSIRLGIRNDGVTIEDNPDAEKSGIGVRIMHFRAGVIGARLRIEPVPGGGTNVMCILPRG